MSSCFFSSLLVTLSLEQCFSNLSMQKITWRAGGTTNSWSQFWDDPDAIGPRSTLVYSIKNWCWTSVVVQCLKTLPSHAGGVGLISDQGTKVPHAGGPKNIKQKQYCSKFRKDFKNGPHQNKKKFKKELKDNCFTEFCCFLSNLSMNQP